MKITRLLLLPLLASASLAAAQTSDLISFEPDSGGYLPDGTLAVDELRVTNQFQASQGVRFGIDRNGDLQIDAGTYAILEKGGSADSDSGFVSSNGAGKDDTAAP